MMNYPQMRTRTTTSSSLTAAVEHTEGGVSLRRVLECRKGPLNEIECWAVLGQARLTIQQMVTSPPPPPRSTTIQSFIRSTHPAPSSPQQLLENISLDTLHCTPVGRVKIAPPSPSATAAATPRHHTSYVPRTEDEVVSAALKSLAQTLTQSLDWTNGSSSCKKVSAFKSPLVHVLASMEKLDIKTLNQVEQLVDSTWIGLVGKTPLARFVGQLCKVTLGWDTIRTRSTTAVVASHYQVQQTQQVHQQAQQQPTKQASLSSMNPSPKPLFASSPVKSERSSSASDVIAERSKCSSSSSAASDVISNGSSTTSSVFNGQYGRRLDYKPTVHAVVKPVTSSASNDVIKQRRRAQRNPSRLYRVVKPLAEIASAPSPATKRCIGPEFVVMSMEKEAVQLDLCKHHTRKDMLMVKDIEVIMLNGQKWVVQVNPSNITAGEVLENVLREQDITESAMFALCLQMNGDPNEFCPLSNDLKLNKVAPQGWKDSLIGGGGGSSKAASNNNLWPHPPFVLHQRFRFLPRDLDAQLRDPKNKHQLYLQLRRDVLSGRYRMPVNLHLSVAAMALQVEFGDFSEDVHGDDYFMLEHYVPKHVIDQIGGISEAKACLEKLHRGYLGQSQSKTELKFVREIENLSDFGFHLFEAGTSSGSCSQKRKLGVHIEGIFLFDESVNDLATSHQVSASFFWHKINRIQYDKTRFQLLVGDEQEADTGDKAGGGGGQKVKFYVSEMKAKLLFDLASSHHQYSNKLKARDNQRVEIEEQLEYREPQRALRSLKSRLLSRRHSSSQRKLYTSTTPTSAKSTLPTSARRALLKSGGSTPLVGGLRRSFTTAAMQSPSKKGVGGRTPLKKEENYLVKRLAHYTSMADALVHTKEAAAAKGKRTAEEEETSSSQSGATALNLSDKENSTPVNNKNYRYKFYVEPEEDENPQGGGTAHSRNPPSQSLSGQRAIPSQSNPSSSSVVPPKPHRLPLQEKPVSAYYPEAASVATPVSTAAASAAHLTKRRPRMITAAPHKLLSSATKKKTSEILSSKIAPAVATEEACTLTGVKTRGAAATTSGGATAETPGAGSGMRMGTRISLSALHRERLRLASELGLPGTLHGGSAPVPPPPMMMMLGGGKKAPSGGGGMFAADDLTLMETKSILPRPPPSQTKAFVVHAAINNSQEEEGGGASLGGRGEPFSLNTDSLSDSLLERFDAMETEESEPERRIVSVNLHKDANGKLGLKITSTASGIYVQHFQPPSASGDQTQTVRLGAGDRIVAINGRSVENVSHQGALDLIKKSSAEVQLIVSQITTAAAGVKH